MSEKLFREIDPTTVSLLEIRPEEIEFTGRYAAPPNMHPVYRDKQGIEYVEIYHNPSLQILTARLLKGIVNTADYVRCGDMYLSRIVDLRKIEEPTDIMEVLADLLLLAGTFDDSDHCYPNHNMCYLPNKRQHVFYDFEGKLHYASTIMDIANHLLDVLIEPSYNKTIPVPASIKQERPLDCENEKEVIKSLRKMFAFLEEEYPKVRPILFFKLNALQARLEGEQGLRMLNSSIQNVHPHTPAQDIPNASSIQQNLLKRIMGVKDLLSKSSAQT